MIDLTPLDVRKKKGDFRKGLRGYEMEEVDGFLARVRELAERHPDTTLEVGGPWPPYSFAA